jgi:polysaccharide biosynthesis transport protein
MQWKVLVAITLLAVSVAGVYCVVAPRKYEARALLHVSSQTGQEVRVSEVIANDQGAASRITVNTQLDLLKSRNLREEVMRRYEALGFGDLTLEGGGASALGAMLTVAPRRDSELVDVTVADRDPDRAARLVNLVAEVFREQTLEGRRDSAREAKVWLNKQLDEYRQRIVTENAALIEYQQINDLADAEEDVTRLSSSTSALNSAYGDVTMERALLETTVRSHENLVSRGEWETVAKDMATPLVGSLTEEYARVATENAQVASRYLPDHPDRKALDARLAGVLAELQKEVRRTLATERAQLAALRSSEGNLVEESDDAKALLLRRQGLLAEYERLKLQLEQTKAFYATLSQRDGELELASRTQLSNVRVVDDARPNANPVSPKITQSMLLALILGLVAGGIAAFLVEYLNDTISTPFDVTTYLRIPFLGIVPRLVEKVEERIGAMYLVERPTTPGAEAVRAIRAVLELSPKAESLKRVLVTSSQTGEGKTNTVSNLAVAFAVLGRRVLLLDADMRRPRLHRVYDVERERGLSSILQGTLTADEAIVRTHVPNLDLLPAGPVPSGPNELIASVAMADLLTELDRRYDIVFIDTPPSGLLSDAVLLSKRVDGVIFVVREKRVSRRLASEAVHRLRQVGAPLLGAIVNDVDLSGASSRYRYHYEYQYQYTEKRPAEAAK